MKSCREIPPIFANPREHKRRAIRASFVKDLTGLQFTKADQSIRVDKIQCQAKIRGDLSSLWSALEESQNHRAEAGEGNERKEQEPSHYGNGARKGKNDGSPK